MFRNLAIAFLSFFVMVFSFNLNADVVKWVDSEGKTHYSNKVPKKNKKASQKIKFTDYEKPEKVEVVIEPKVDWSKDFVQIGDTYQLKTDTNNQRQNSAKSRQRKQANSKAPTIAELRAQCDIAREERLAPARAEAIEDCIYNNERHTKNVVAFCERFNRTFGDEQRGTVYSGWGFGRSRVVSRQRLFHNIPECKRLYRAEDKRSNLNRGYSNE